MNKDSIILIAGDTGLVGSNLKKMLINQGYTNIIGINSKVCNLLNKKDVDEYFSLFKPEYVFLVAGKVGGIHANNTYSADFFYENINILFNTIHAAYKYKTIKLLLTGSSCIYPRECSQPIKEEYLMTAPLETTNSAYATAKIAGIEMCKAYRKQYGCNFISVMPTNLYGENDNFSLEDSHVLPGMIRKFHEAKKENKSIELWGTGSPRREFLHVDDLADALVFLMNNYDDSEHINVGYGSDISIKELSNIIRENLNFKNEVYWNTSFPDGTPQKLLDSSKIKELGWESETNLKEGISKTYKWFLENYNNIRK